MGRASGLLVVIILLAACGASKAAPAPAAPVASVSSGHDTTTTSTPAVNYGQQYLAIVGPANAAGNAAVIPDNPTGARLAQVFAPVIAAYQKADDALLRAQWPAGAQADIKAMVTADGAVIGDMNAAAGQNALSAASWETQLSSDGAKAKAAANVVRADLGLPPPAS